MVVIFDRTMTPSGKHGDRPDRTTPLGGVVMDLKIPKPGDRPRNVSLCACTGNGGWYGTLSINCEPIVYIALVALSDML